MMSITTRGKKKKQMATREKDDFPRPRVLYEWHQYHKEDPDKVWELKVDVDVRKK